MRYLLDTHVWLWTLASPGQIAPEVLDALADPAHTVLLSAASSWEIAIKYQIGRLPLPEPPPSFVATRLLRDGIEPLPVTHNHALAVAELPPIHKDPFDRLLIAQAKLEKLILVTADTDILRYEVNAVSARG